jgi:hypothetical protein
MPISSIRGGSIGLQMRVDSWIIQKQPICAARVLLLIALLLGLLTALSPFLDGQASATTGEAATVSVFDMESTTIAPSPHDDPASLTCHSTGSCTASAVLHTEVPLEDAIIRGAYLILNPAGASARHVGPESKPPIFVCRRGAARDPRHDTHGHTDPGPLPPERILTGRPTAFTRLQSCPHRFRVRCINEHAERIPA